MGETSFRKFRGGTMMKSLQAQLDAIKAKGAANVPADVLATMKNAMEELHKSGIVENPLKVGAKAPAFALPNGSGDIIRSDGLLQHGPLVVLFYRGKW